MYHDTYLDAVGTSACEWSGFPQQVRRGLKVDWAEGEKWSRHLD